VNFSGGYRKRCDTFHHRAGFPVHRKSRIDSSPFLCYLADEMKKVFAAWLLPAGWLLMAGKMVAQPAAGYTAAFSPPLCTPETISFTNTSGGIPPLTYQWSFGDGTQTDTATNPQHVFDTCGNFTIALITTDSFGLADTFSQSLVIFCSPQVDFFTDDFFSCDSALIQFNDLTAGGNSTRQWTFGDPTSGNEDSSALKNPQHFYDSAGWYLVTLTVTTAPGCIGIKSDSILIPASPAASFQAQDTTVCLNDTARFFDATASGDSIVKWLYDFGDGEIDSSQNPFHVYAAAGEYTVTLTVTSAAGCTNSFSNFISILNLPVANAGNDQTICAGDSAHLLAGGGTVYAWNPASTLSDSTAADPAAFPATSQSYTVSVSDAEGCLARDSVTVFVQQVFADAGSDVTICSGNSVALTAGGGESFLWEPNESLSDSATASVTASPGITTTYTVTVTDSTGCSGVDSVTVTVADFFEISFAGLDTVYCANEEPVMLSASPSGGIFSGAGVADQLFFPGAVKADSTYTIYYFYSDSAGCNAADSILFEVKQIPPVSISSLDSSVCLNGNSIPLMLSPPGGLLTGEGIAGENFDPSLISSAGNYWLVYTVTDSVSCSNRDSLLIGVFALPPVELSNDTTICEGDSIQLFAWGGQTFAWFPASGLTDDSTSNPVCFADSTTTYFVTATDSNECAATDSVKIAVFSVSEVNAGNDTSLCAGDSLQLSATGGAGYSWMPEESLSDATLANPFAFPAATTTYTLTVTAGSCTATDSITLAVNSLPVIMAGVDTFVCAGNSVQLFASGAEIFAWQPDSSLSNAQAADPIASPEVSTIYRVTGTDANGCFNHDSVVVEVKSLPVVAAGNDTAICSGDSVPLFVSGAETYAWMPAASLSDSSSSFPIAFPIYSTSYLVTGTDGFGCSSNDSVVVTVNFSGNFVTATDTPTCAGTAITLSAAGAESYSWSPGNALNDSTISNPTALLFNSTTFIVTGSSAGCSGTDTITVFVHPLPDVSASNDTTICAGNSVQLNATGADFFQWQPEIYLDNSQVPSPLSTPLEPVTYIVTGTDANGCSKSDTTMISITPLPVISIDADSSLCAGESILMIASGAAVYTWQPAALLSDPQNDSTLAAPITTTTFTVTATDSNGCSNTAVQVVEVNDLPSADAGNNQLVCPLLPVQLNAAGGIFFSWQPVTGLSDPTIANPTALVNETITYTVTVTDANNCSAADSVSLTPVEPPVTSVSADTAICTGSMVQLFASGGSSYEWHPASGLNNVSIPDPVASPESTTTYSVFISDGFCYTDTLQVTVTTEPLPSVNAGEDALVINGSSYSMTAMASEGIYQWLPVEGLSCSDCLNPVASPAQTTTYTLTVTSSPGCSASDEVTLTLNCGTEVIFVPSAFTPNKNGQNDVLYLRTIGSVNLNFFRVYDRWGKVIFETGDPANGWDGTYKGKAMMPGVYLFEWEAMCSGGDLLKKQGNVTLLR
jgi:gliding motility-associated-like protein